MLEVRCSCERCPKLAPRNAGPFVFKARLSWRPQTGYGFACCAQDATRRDLIEPRLPVYMRDCRAIRLFRVAAALSAASVGASSRLLRGSGGCFSSVWVLA